MSLPTETGKAACYYAEEFGWKLLPVWWPRSDGSCACGDRHCDKVGKHPIFGIRSANNDIDTLTQRWAQYPQAGVAIYLKGSLLTGLDIDKQYGGSLDALPLTAAARKTPTVRTGSGGLHYYYEAPPNLRISQSAELMPPGIDIRHEGYLVAPPSLHQSGQCYQWLAGREPWNVTPLPMPMSLLPHIKFHNWPESEPVAAAAQPKLDIGEEGRLRTYFEVAIRKELDRLGCAEYGQRNNELNRSSFIFGQLIAVDVLSRSQAEELLMQSAVSIGLGKREAERTIASGINAGLKNPRQLPDFS